MNEYAERTARSAAARTDSASSTDGDDDHKRPSGPPRRPCPPLHRAADSRHACRPASRTNENRYALVTIVTAAEQAIQFRAVVWDPVIPS